MAAAVVDTPADPSTTEAAAVAAALGTNPQQGLSAAQAASRLLRDGPNTLRTTPQRPAWRRALAQLQDPLVGLLLAAGAVAALARMTAATSSAWRDGRVQQVPSSQLVRGDVLVLAEGDAVGDRLNMVFKGTAVAQGSGRALVTATGMQLASVQTLGSASVIATDKTGTLTRAEMTVVRMLTASGAGDTTGVGYAPNGQVGQVEQTGAGLQEGPLRQEIAAVLAGGSLAGNAQLHQASPGVWQIQGDPTEAAFQVAERKPGGAVQRQQRDLRRAEIPFTSDRKRMSTIEADQDQQGAPMLSTKGSPRAVLARCTRARVGTATVDLDSSMRQRFLADVDALADAALRTLAGIRVVMITGDHPRTALRIAADLGLMNTGAQAPTALELDAMDDAALATAVHHTAVFARVAPKDKRRTVHALQADGAVVAMTGDGVNDAPALKAADIGVAMGRTGTEATKEAARRVLADDNVATIVEAVREGRGVLDNIRKFRRDLLSSNLGELPMVFGGVVATGLIGLDLAGVDTGRAGSAVVLPLLATPILWINLVTDAGPALAMGVDPIADDVTARAPRRLGEAMIDRPMWLGVLGTGLVLAQLFKCFNARAETASAWRGLFSNRWLWGAVLLSVLLQVAVVHVPLLNSAFGTVPLDATQWLACTGMAGLVLWLGEGRKLVHRAWLRRGRGSQRGPRPALA